MNVPEKGNWKQVLQQSLWELNPSEQPSLSTAFQSLIWINNFMAINVNAANFECQFLQY